jgi:hypothetical protein
VNPRLDAVPIRTTGFDFLVGHWRVENDRLRRPLTGSEEWYSSTASATSMTLHNGAVSVDEMYFAEEGFAGSAFRLHDAEGDLWSIYWVNSRDGLLQPPVRGCSDGDLFTATGDDSFEGRPIVAQFLWHSVTPRTATWEQAFSVDDGRSWETNWVMRWTRVAA